ncbi:MJ1255/VC2487 family glycosyltransferase [Zobellella iuensis]|uniref:Glycosyltransferase n=1 Tax=Zobellella iuensis TaxID=2803811 RepID=A0ABS1QQX9_9GAMM|nr:MJ1255/VC2487 family glycosyltransferase [Zobellella iuensis]MBL1377277.1 glycosyltransferase [Zobellella iuensis]
MRILYGVQGTGNGHITRARALGAALRRRGLAVDFLFSGRPPEDYFDMAEFGDYQSRTGVTFVTRGGCIAPLASLGRCRPLQLLGDIRALPVRDYDLVLTDFEPATAWAARRAGVPCVGISHQAAFLSDIPRQGENWLNRQLVRHFAPAGCQLGLHWHHFGQKVLPPLMEPAPPATAIRPDKVLVYLPFEEQGDIAALLGGFPHVQFYCYHPKAEPREQGHLHWRAPSRQGFRRDLAEAAGVIANSGFELPSEALSLGKKLLVKPVGGQFEQLSNALALARLNLGSVMARLDNSAVAAWLARPDAEPVHYPEVAEQLVDWLLAGDRRDPAPLCESLWRQVRFPSYCTLPGN